MSVRSRLTELALTLPAVAAPIANYVPYSRMGNILHISGQIPRVDGKPVTGLVGASVTVEGAQEAAKICALSIIAQIDAATGGNLDKVKQFHKLGVFVAAGPDFTQQPAVANGASDLIVSVFGDKGKHARSAVGVASLPLGVCVEIDAIVELDP